MKKRTVFVLAAVLILLLAGSAVTGRIPHPDSRAVIRAESTVLPWPAAEPDSPERALQVEEPVLAPDSVQDAGHNAGPSFAANTFDLSFFIALIAAAALLGVTFSRGKD